MPATTSVYVRNVLIARTSRCAHVFCYLSLVADCCRPLCVATDSISRVSRSASTVNPPSRNALAKALRCTAVTRHAGSGCSQAPRPGMVFRWSITTAGRPSSVQTTSRTSSVAGRHCRHPTQVRIGIFSRWGEGSLWTTAKSTVLGAADANATLSGEFSVSSHPPPTRRGRDRAGRRYGCRYAIR